MAEGDPAGTAMIDPGGVRGRGVSTRPVRHVGYVFKQLNPRAYGHHKLYDGTPPGAYRCYLCGRLVVRGMGRWWL